MKRILPVLLVLLLIVSALLPVTGAATTTVGSHQNTEFSPACDRTVSVQTASSIASLKINEIAGNIPGFENWQKGDVEFLKGLHRRIPLIFLSTDNVLDIFLFQQPGIIILFLSSLKGLLPISIQLS